MSSIKLWLPAVIDDATYNSWDEFLTAVYRVFRKDFLTDNVCNYRDRPVEINRTLENGKEKTFWHLVLRTERGRKWGKRKIEDPQRAKRIPWIRPIIENSNDEEVREWDYYEGSGTVRTYLWLDNWDFVVILESCDNYYILVTAFYIDYPRKRVQLLEKYQKRIE